MLEVTSVMIFVPATCAAVLGMFDYCRAWW
jgi:hypothetical protein